MTTPTFTTTSGQVLAVDLSTRDFEGFRYDILEFAEVVAPDWTDRSEADVGVTLVEAFAFIGDNLSFYQDRCANEALWPSITQRRSIIEQAKAIGYELGANVSASVDLTFTHNGAGVVPAGTQIQVDTSDGSDPATFELENDFAPVGPGVTTGVTAFHGSTVSETIGSSDNSVGQSYTLRQSPLAYDPGGSSSLQVWVAEGGPPALWSKVVNFHDSGPTDTHYRVEIDENDIVTIFFGDGTNGKVPAAGTNNITGTYRVAYGPAGNRVGVGRLKKLIGSFPFIDSVTNPAQPSGGSSKESIAQAKVNGPLSLRAMNRAVTHIDYKTLALEVPGVSQARAYRDAGAVYEEIVVIAASGSNPVPSGSWDPYTETGAGLIGAVGAYILARCTTPIILRIEPCQFFRFRTVVEAHLFSTVRRTDVERYIEDAMIEAFDVGALLLGEEIPLSKVYDVIEDVKGVDYLNLIRFQRQPYARKRSTWSSSDPTCSIEVGTTTLRDRWTLTWISPTQFSVYGASSGDQTNIGQMGISYTTDDGGLTFTFTAGAVAPSVDEKWEIITGPYLGNMEPDSDELGALYDSNLTLSLVGGQ